MKKSLNWDFWVFISIFLILGIAEMLAPNIKFNYNLLTIPLSILLFILFWKNLYHLYPNQLLAAIINFILFSGIGWIVSTSLVKMHVFEKMPQSSTNVIILLFGYMGIYYIVHHKKEIPYFSFAKYKKWQDTSNEEIEHLNKKPILLDSSVLIDARIAKIADTNFLNGTLIVPSFILRELQNIADSTDSLRREKGRRGLDVVKNLQQKKELDIKIENTPIHVKAVDNKLVTLAKMNNYQIMTTDYNLNKVATIEGVTVLNINDLANALKPILLPGEEIEVLIQKEGKEHNQGIGYTDDGTMIVVENGKYYIGKKVNTVVTSVLQTSAGQMIFTHIKD